MPEVVLQGVPVRFPFEPYDVQKTYMSKVIECVQRGENGILESPTGTGKTLCLLCSTLAWLEIKKAEHKSRLQVSNTPPKIIYSSRTHSQLSQAISELKRTSYSHLRVAILGSRGQMCVHPEVSKEVNNSTKVHMCQMRVKAKTCYFHNQVDAKKDEPELRQGILDLEDLVKFGKKKSFCPYYMARDLKQDADIIFMPYNYLLDPKSRKAHAIELQGNIIIFDEAHNVEKMCEEAASLQIRSTDIALCIDEVTQVMKKFQDISEGSDIAANDSQGLPEDFNPDDLYTLKALFLELEKAIDAIQLPADGSGSTFPGSYMFELLEKADITPYKKIIILEILDKLIQYLTTNSASPFQRKGAGLQKFSELLQIVFSKDKFSLEHMEFVKQCYKASCYIFMSVHINIEEQRKKPGGREEGWGAPKSNPINSKVGRVISYWCFNPGFAMKDLSEMGVKSIILTSGTLSPIDSFTSELQVPFPIQLENPHIIKRHQVWVGIVSKGPDGFSLNSSFRNRSDPRYIASLGQTILNFSRVIPGGLLVFFPSYSIMRFCRDEWQNSGIWSKISIGKPIFVEPQTKEEFNSAMEEFYIKINDPTLKGACFMAVCRGKVSEGLDFADRNGRAVIVTGLPYPPFKDPRVVLKQKYLEEIRTKCKQGLTGYAWYQLEASRAVNQAIGRVIRHKDDFGAIILCDNRFSGPDFKAQLSSWVRPHVNTYNVFGPAMRDIIQFFKNAQTLLPQPAAKNKGQPALSVKYETPESTFQVPVSAHAFQADSSRSVISESTKKKMTEALRKESDYNAVWSSMNYTKSVGREKVSMGDNSIFSALEQKSSVVDFNACSVSSQCSSDYGSIKIQNKKRKIKLVPNIDSVDSANCGEKQGSQNTMTHILKPLNQAESSSPDMIGSGSSSGSQDNITCGQGEFLHPAASIDGHVKGDVNCKPSSSRTKTSDGISTSKKENGDDKKLSSIAAYIKEVKSSLNKEQYAEFSAAVKSYKQKKDYERMVDILASLFIDNPQYHRLFRKFEQFLNKEHRPQFQETCSQILPQ
ncbi:regulator of telomere elongation helicase 1-like [Homarus americanus]|uniref:Regulator of telomere elongation helicase 1 homolog n=1 Tax=Homarus americanus TaxID=6706 RepID=A0A8J5MVB2_HOMAM|nr:regulator of telomere elongation helicase 1-like [Homarus americanus]